MPDVEVCGFSAAELARILEDNNAAKLELLGQINGGEVRRSPELLIMSSGVPHPFVNTVACARLPAEHADERIADAIDHFRNRSLPFHWLVGPSSAPPDLGSRLIAQGMRLATTSVAMALDLEHRVPADPFDGLTVSRVATQKEVSEWTGAWVRAWDMPRAIGQVFADAIAAYGLEADSILRAYTGRLDGKVIGARLAVLAVGALGLWESGTVPEARGQGLAGPMSDRIKRDAMAAGYKLQVGAMLERNGRISRRHARRGNIEFGRIQTYVWTPGPLQRVLNHVWRGRA
jgi:hypothetical protein